MATLQMATLQMATLLTRNETSTDNEWVQAARKNRYDVKIFEFNKISNATAIRTLKGPGNSLQAFDHRYDDGDRAKSGILRASRHLGVNFPGSEGKLKRDYFMVSNAASLYFVGNFSKGNERLQIKGNEAWIVEMFFDKLLGTFEKVPNRFPIYMFCEYFGCWCQLAMSESKTDRTKKEYNWLKIKAVPRPVGNFIGIGGSKLSSVAKIELSFV